MLRSDKRKAKRQFLHYRAQIVGRGGDGEISCVIRDVSETGARVMTDAPDQLPDEFILCLTKTGRPRRHCRVVWRSETAAGVTFAHPLRRRKVTEMGVAAQPYE